MSKEEYILRDKIIAEMKFRKWSVYRLAKESGTNWAALDYFLKGKKDIHGKTIERLLLALDFDIEGFKCDLAE